MYTPRERRMLKVLKGLEWAGNHTDYEDSWSVLTVACPWCRNDKKDGHKPGCELAMLIG